MRIMISRLAWSTPCDPDSKQNKSMAKEEKKFPFLFHPYSTHDTTVFTEQPPVVEYVFTLCEDVSL